MTDAADLPAGPAARALMGLKRAMLGSLALREGAVFPFVSLVLPGLDAAGQPLLLLSDLADHARNLARDPAASLLFDGTLDLAQPLTGPRLTLLGRVEAAPSPDDRAAYLTAQPGAALYAGFGDFRLYRFRVQEGLLVAGFGRIHRLLPEDLLSA